jgi:hypothetical protein
MSAQRLLIAILLAAPVVGCEAPPVVVTDVAGKYRADVPSGRVTLAINGDGTWEYLIDGPSRFRRTGKWTLEDKQSTRSVVAISLENFDFGFPLRGSKLLGPHYQYFYFEKTYAGKMKTCLENLGMEWGPKARLCFERE